MTVEVITLFAIAGAMGVGVWIATRLVRPKADRTGQPTALGRILLASIVAAAFAIGVWLGSPDNNDLMTLVVGVPLAVIAVVFAFRASKGT